MEDILKTVTCNNKLIISILLLFDTLIYNFYVLQTDIMISIFTNLTEIGSLEPKHLWECILEVDEIKQCILFKVYYE